MSELKSYAAKQILQCAGIESQATCDHRHAVLHRGRSYHVDYSCTDAAPLADDGSIRIWIPVPATTGAHAYFTFWPEGLAQAYIFEGGTMTDPGTLMTPVNRNRAVTRDSLIPAYHTPTVDTDGTCLWDTWLGGTFISQTISGMQGFELAPSTGYLFVLTARAQGLRASIHVDWVE